MAKEEVKKTKKKKATKKNKVSVEKPLITEVLAAGSEIKITETAVAVEDKPVEVVETTEATVEPEAKTQEEKSVTPQPIVKKKASRRLVMMVLSAIALLLGVGSFFIYFFTQNIFLGAPGVILGLGGFFLFRHYWNQESDIVVEHMIEAKVDPKLVNVLGIYRDKVVFESVGKEDLLGFPWTCKNDKRKYYVHIHDMPSNGNSPHAFILPDQQYYDPVVFAERPLALPAHQKIFRRKEKLGHYIKTALLVVAIIIVWIVILTTTGEGG